ncbi:MAG TPA: DUF192 domain-containing protein [Coleofasciculaceae cyanobacterium]|jgi:hypothetical protein
MSSPKSFQSGGAWLLAGVLAGMLFFWNQNSQPNLAHASDPKPGTVASAASSGDSLMDGQPQTGLPEMDMLLDGKRYRLEVTATQVQAQKGLMYRTRLSKNHGMLFRFQPARKISFWMKNTRIPLDMLFVRDGEIRHIVQGAKPCVADPCVTYPSGTEVDTVVELPAGTVKKNHIQPGDRIQFENPQFPAEDLRQGK